MLDFGICVIANAFRIHITYRFVELFLGTPKEAKGKILFHCILFYIINTALFWELRTAWINIVCNLVGIGILVRFYTKSLKTNLFVTGAVYTISLGCDVGVNLLFIHYEDGQKYSQIYVACSILLLFICELAAEKIVTNRRGTGEVSRFPLICIPLFSILMICILIYSDVCEDSGIAIVGSGLLVMNLLMLYLYNLLLYCIPREYEAELLRQKVQIYSNQIALIAQSEEKVKALRHDMKHHMNEIKMLASKYDAEDILEYIDKMQEFINESGEIVNSGNVEIDSVLNYMLQKAREELGEVRAKVKLPENLLHSFEVNVIIGNLLENAIEAAGKTEEKYLKICVMFDKGVLRILTENSFLAADGSSKNQDSNEKIRAVKRVSKKHYGIGLKNVRKIVESYHGVMEITAEGNIFKVEIMLYLERQAVS